MILRRFTSNSYIYVDEMDGGFRESASLAEGLALSGEGDFVGGNLVALYVSDAKLLLRVSDKVINLQDPVLELKYKHIDGGITQFFAADADFEVEISYESWWRNFPLASPAYGMPEDKELDFCAFVVYIVNSEVARGNYMKEYSWFFISDD